MRRRSLGAALVFVAFAAQAQVKSASEIKSLSQTIKYLEAGKSAPLTSQYVKSLKPSPNRLGELVEMLNQIHSAEIVSSLSTVFGSDTKAIYPTEDGGAIGPREICDEAIPAKVRAAQSGVAALVPSSRIYALDQGRTFALVGASYSQRYRTCGEVPFGEQEVVASCTGFLRDGRHLLTASHCVPEAPEALEQFKRENRVVFGYRAEAPGKIRTTVSADEVYQIKDVVSRSRPAGDEDWAVLELERSVVARGPVETAGGMQLKRKQRLFALGHPNGLPLKVALGFVLVEPAADSVAFAAALDTFHGNSGSPVFDWDTGKVVGILVRGAPDYVFDPARDCNHLLVCGITGDCAGESVMRISRVPP